jgi:hypothetical protein
MVQADKTLVLAGPPNIFATDDPTATLEGKGRGLLQTVSAGDGKKQAEYQLESPPVFDGMAIAGGRVYLSTMDGKITCFAGE